MKWTKLVKSKMINDENEFGKLSGILPEATVSSKVKTLTTVELEIFYIRKKNDGT